MYGATAGPSQVSVLTSASGVRVIIFLVVVVIKRASATHFKTNLTLPLNSPTLQFYKFQLAVNPACCSLFVY